MTASDEVEEAEADPCVQDRLGRVRLRTESGLSFSELLDGKSSDRATGACSTVIGKAANLLRDEHGAD